MGGGDIRRTHVPPVATVVEPLLKPDVGSGRVAGECDVYQAGRVIF